MARNSGSSSFDPACAMPGPSGTSAATIIASASPRPPVNRWPALATSRMSSAQPDPQRRGARGPEVVEDRRGERRAELHRACGAKDEQRWGHPPRLDARVDFELPADRQAVAAALGGAALAGHAGGGKRDDPG